jgi:drug/metabolite transporter (DMT)-like permease
MTRTQRDGLLLIFLAAAAYALLPIFAKIVYTNDPNLEPLDVLTWRFVFAAPGVWLARLALRPAPAPAGFSRNRMIGMGVLFMLVAACAFFALARVPASLYTALLYTYPAMVAILSAVLGEPLPWRGWVALGLTLVGVLLTIPAEDNAAFAALSDPVGGVLFCLFNALLYAVYLVINGRLLKGQASAPIHMAVWNVTGSFLSLLVLAPFHGLTLPTQPSAWLALAGLGLICTVIPTFAMLGGIQRLGAARASILSTSEPIMTVILALLLLPDETMTAPQLLGGALILLSVIVLELRSSPARRAAVESLD